MAGKARGTLCAIAIAIDVRKWLIVAAGPTAPQLGGVALASLFFYGSSLWRRQRQGEFKDSVY